MGDCIAFNHEHLILRHVKIEDLGRRKLKEITANAARGPVMGDNDGVRCHAFNPSRNRPVHVAVGLTARHRDVPPVGLPAGVSLGFAGLDIRPGQACPRTEADFLQSIIRAIAERRNVHRVAHDLHGLTRPQERACDKVEPVFLADQFGKAAAIAASLSATFSLIGISKVPWMRFEAL